ERPYKVDGAGELARQSAARCSTPKINGPVVQQQFTSTCSKETIVAIATTKKQVRATNACQRNNNGRTPKFQFYRGHFMDKIQKSRMHHSQRRALTNGDGVKAMVFFCLASVLADANVSAASPDNGHVSFTPQERNHWAFQNITRPKPPKIDQPDWARNPIDAFVVAELK